MKVVYAIPGLGTTKELYRNIRIDGHELKVLSWPPPQQEYDLPAYAAQFISQINTHEPVNLLGVSFGGMLCAELAEQITVNKTVLISSCRNACEFPISLKLLRIFPVHRLFPDRLIRLIAKTKRRFLGFEKSFEPVFFQMIDQMPLQYFSHCIHYIITWQRKSNAASIVQVHGTYDRLLSSKKIGNFYSVKNGTHSMVLARANEINAILNQEFNAQ